MKITIKSAENKYCDYRHITLASYVVTYNTKQVIVFYHESRKSTIYVCPNHVESALKTFIAIKKGNSN